MKLGFSQQEIIATAKSLGLPTDGFIQRRLARAIDLVATDKVTEVDDSIFRVHSQYDAAKSYIVNLNGDWGCDCPDHQKHTGAGCDASKRRLLLCKHMIASMLYAQRQAQDEAITIVKTTDGNEGDYWRRCWLIAQGNRRTLVYEEHDRQLFCTCGAHFGDCIHKKLVIETVTKELKVVNECGSTEAQALQDKMNGQSDSSKNNGNGAYCAPSQPEQLNINDAFQESELKDIAQIEGKAKGDLAWTLRNGETVISYAGVMALAEKHSIEFTVSHHEDTNTVIAYARRNENRSERVSGKPVRISGSIPTASELAKRNAARQLIPFAEIKVLELKAKLEADFSWEKEKAKCLELVPDFELDIVIHELVKAGNLRQDNPSHYNRIEWLIIHNACKKDREQSDDNDGGVNSPPSPSLDPKSVNNVRRFINSDNHWSYNSPEFISKCRDAIQKVRDDKVEAAEMPLQKPEGKRKLQMDSKLRTFLIETDLTSKPISCREICEKFDSNIVTRLRAGIDSGADLSTVELDD